jgi:hypothetical protein
MEGWLRWGFMAKPVVGGLSPGRLTTGFTTDSVEPEEVVALGHCCVALDGVGEVVCLVGSRDSLVVGCRGVGDRRRGRGGVLQQCLVEDMQRSRG